MLENSDSWVPKRKRTRKKNAKSKELFYPNLEKSSENSIDNAPTEQLNSGFEKSNQGFTDNANLFRTACAASF